MDLAAPPCLPRRPSSSSLLLKSRVRVFQRTWYPTYPPSQASIFSVNQCSLTRMDLPRDISSAAFVGENSSPTTPLTVDSGARIGEVKKVTKETNVSVKMNLDGCGVADSSTGIPFLDHMLALL